MLSTQYIFVIFSSKNLELYLRCGCEGSKVQNKVSKTFIWGFPKLYKENILSMIMPSFRTTYNIILRFLKNKLLYKIWPIPRLKHALLPIFIDDCTQHLPQLIRGPLLIFDNTGSYLWCFHSFSEMALEMHFVKFYRLVFSHLSPILIALEGAFSDILLWIHPSLDQDE